VSGGRIENKMISLPLTKLEKKEILKNIAAGSFVKDFGLGKVWWSAFKA